ncbi:hypothetical protein Tco_0849532 [Tanacetum coccineum]
MLEPKNETTPATIRARTKTDLTNEEKIRESVDIKATNIVLQGLPQYIYNLVNHNEHAKEIWDRVKLLIQGSELSLQKRESKLAKNPRIPVPIGDRDRDVNRFPDRDGDEAEKWGWGWSLPVYVQKAFDNRCTYSRGAFLKDINIQTNTELTLEQTQQGVSDEVLIDIMDLVMQSTTLPSHSRSDTYAGNLVKEILLKLNLSDHMSILTEPEVHVKMEMEIPRSSKVKFITACSYLIDEYNDMMKAQIYDTQDFRYSDTQRSSLKSLCIQDEAIQGYSSQVNRKV